MTIVEGIPAFKNVLRAIAEELEAGKIFIAKETTKVSPKRYKEMRKLFHDVEVELIPHSELMELSHKAHAPLSARLSLRLIQILF